jgi:hypothetical protein
MALRTKAVKLRHNRNAIRQRRKLADPPHQFNVTELEQSHAELRAALVIAGKEIRKLQFGRKDSPVLEKLRAVLRDARKVSRAERNRVRVTMKL